MTQPCQAIYQAIGEVYGRNAGSQDLAFCLKVRNVSGLGIRDRYGHGLSLGAGASGKEQPPKLSGREGNHHTHETESTDGRETKDPRIESETEGKGKVVGGRTGECREFLRKCLHIFMQARD
jgi:hypothetical protein